MKAGARLKAIAKGAVKSAVLALAPFHPRGGDVCRILTYHSVGKRDHEMNVSPAAFRDQVHWLADHQNLLDMEAAVAGGAGVAITFDDGYRDNLTEAAPILKDAGAPAAFFVVAGRLGGRLDHDDGRTHADLMTWDEVLELEGMGFTIGAHTMTHRRLSSLSEGEQREEVAECWRILDERLHNAVRGFAYPFGSALDYTERTKVLVREAGFSYALSNRYGANGRDADRWALRRIWIDRSDSLRTFKAKVDGRLDGLSLLDSRAAIRARRGLNRFLGTA